MEKQFDYGRLISEDCVSLEKSNENFSVEELLAYGYLPLEYTQEPIVDENYSSYYKWVKPENEHKLVQTWLTEEITYSPEYNKLVSQIVGMEESLSQLTFTLNRLSEMVTEVVKKDDSDMPLGDYVNPLRYIEGMSVEAGLFYTDGDNIWEAIKNGTPQNFSDQEYFDIILV